MSTDIARHIGQNLLNRLDYMKLQPRTILVAGLGVDYFVKVLKKRYPNARIITSQGTPVASFANFTLKIQNIFQKLTGVFLGNKKPANKNETVDLNSFPILLETDSIDLIFTNLLLPNHEDVASLLIEIQRILNPKGVLLFSTLGPDSFKELVMASQTINVSLDLPQCVDMHHLGDLLVRSHFADPVTDRQELTITYSHMMDLLTDAKLLVMDNQFTALTLKKIKLTQAYQIFCDNENNLLLSLEVIYGNAWGSQVASGNRRQSTGDIEVPLVNITRA